MISTRRPMNRGPQQRTGGSTRLLIALVMVAFALISYFGSRQNNAITGETQYISLTEQQEIALGVQSAPEMIAQHGGLYPDERVQDYVDEVGFKLVNETYLRDTNPRWEYEFHLLRDPDTINAFALPGGQIFITAALYSKFTTEGQLAAVLAHEVGHVVARHGAQRISQQNLTQGLIGAVFAASGDQGTAQMAALAGQLINMKYGRDDEIQSDTLGIGLMIDAGYDPRSMISVMDILAQSAGGAPPEFFSTHPNPDNRIEKIQATIDEFFPSGVPDSLIP
ncbi:MAG: M48 family metalloprotease [Chloroflexota bacterium]